MNQFVSSKEKKRLQTKLKGISQNGVQLYLDGKPASPKEIAEKHYVNEEQIYMQDIIISDCGEWTEMHFNKVVM